MFMIVSAMMIMPWGLLRCVLCTLGKYQKRLLLPLSAMCVILVDRGGGFMSSILTSKGGSDVFMTHKFWSLTVPSYLTKRNVLLDDWLKSAWHSSMWYCKNTQFFCWQKPKRSSGWTDWVHTMLQIICKARVSWQFLPNIWIEYLHFMCLRKVTSENTLN